MTLERHPGNLPGTPPRRTRGRAGLKGICPSVCPSARGAGQGGEDAGGGRGPCTHAAPVPPGLNLHGTHHFPGPPSHPENRVGPRGLPNSGSPALPRAARAQHPIHGRSAVQLCPRRSGSVAPRAPRKRPLKAGCSRLQTLPTPHRRPARRNTDGARRPDASHAEPGPHTQQQQEGRRLPTCGHRNRGSVARQPQLCPDGEPEPWPMDP